MLYYNFIGSTKYKIIHIEIIKSWAYSKFIAYGFSNNPLLCFFWADCLCKFTEAVRNREDVCKMKQLDMHLSFTNSFETSICSGLVIKSTIFLTLSPKSSANLTVLNFKSVECWLHHLRDNLLLVVILALKHRHIE